MADLVIRQIGVDAAVWTAIFPCAMKVIHSDGRLERMESERTGRGAFPKEVVEGYLKCMDIINAAANSSELRAFKSRRLEKLQGARRLQHSMRINDKWRLILLLRDGDEPVATIIAIEDYH